MKYIVISYKNLEIQAFTQPILVDISAENYAVQIARALKVTEDATLLKSYKNLIMYQIGEFDDESGLFTQLEGGPRLLSSINQVAQDRLVELNGRKEDTKA